MINKKYTNLDAAYIEALVFNKRYIWDQTSNSYQTLQVKQVVQDDKFQILSVYNDITAWNPIIEDYRNGIINLDYEVKARNLNGRYSIRRRKMFIINKY